MHRWSVSVCPSIALETQGQLTVVHLSVKNAHLLQRNLVPRRSPLPRRPREVWEGVGESLPLTSRLTEQV